MGGTRKRCRFTNVDFGTTENSCTECVLMSLLLQTAILFAFASRFLCVVAVLDSYMERYNAAFRGTGGNSPDFTKH